MSRCHRRRRRFASVATSLTEARLDGWDPTAQFVLVPSTDVLLYPPMDSYIGASAWLLMVVVGLVLLLALYCPRVLGQWFDGIRFYAAASSPRRSRRTWAGLR